MTIFDLSGLLVALGDPVRRGPERDALLEYLLHVLRVPTLLALHIDALIVGIITTGFFALVLKPRARLFLTHVLVPLVRAFIRVTFLATLGLGHDDLACLIHYLLAVAGHEEEVELFRLLGVGVVHDEAAGEAILHGRTRYHLHLLGPARIELEGATRSLNQRSIKGRKEFIETLVGVLRLLLCRAKPLKSRYRYGSIESTRAESKAVAHVRVN